MTQHPRPKDYASLSDLPEERRRELLEHASDCGRCRAILTECDPTAIFSLLALEPMPEFSLARLSRDIESAVAQAELPEISEQDEVTAEVEAEPEVVSPASHRSAWSGIAAVAASLSLAMLLGYQGSRNGAGELGGAQGPMDIAAIQSPQADPGLPGTPTLTAEEFLEAVGFELPPERGVELISSPGDAEVVDFALGETQVVMIFDKALDI